MSATSGSSSLLRRIAASLFAAPPRNIALQWHIRLTSSFLRSLNNMAEPSPRKDKTYLASFDVSGPNLRPYPSAPTRRL